MAGWHARFERDAAFRRAVTDAYAGRLDVSDAVWWADHPELDAPSGAPSPLAARDGLRRAAFARPADGDDPAATLAALREFEAFEAMVERERAATLAAIGAALAAPDARAGSRTRRVVVLAGVVGAAAVVAGVLVLALSTTLAGGGSATPGGGGVAAPDTGGAAIATTSAPGSTTQPFGFGGSEPAPGSVPFPTVSPAPNFPPGIGADSFATVFSHPQAASDLPPDPLPADLRSDSFRALSTGEYTRGSVFAAVSTTNQVCLLVYGNPTDYATSCAEIGIVAERGLQVSLSTPDRRDTATGMLLAAVALSARWEPDGHFTLDSSTPYSRG